MAISYQTAHREDTSGLWPSFKSFAWVSWLNYTPLISYFISHVHTHTHTQMSQRNTSESDSDHRTTPCLLCLPGCCLISPTAAAWLWRPWVIQDSSVWLRVLDQPSPTDLVSVPRPKGLSSSDVSLTDQNDIRDLLFVCVAAPQSLPRCCLKINMDQKSKQTHDPHCTGPV